MDELEAGQAWRESFARFATDWVLGSGDPSCRIALMRVQDFLRLTPPISARIASEDRFVDIDACLAAGTPFSTPLELILEYDGEGASVLSHDGRHRAMRLLDLQPFVPVHIVTEGFPPGDDVLESIETIVPKMHDDDEDYPGWEPEDLDGRQDEVKARDVFQALMEYEDVAEILGIAAGPAPDEGLAGRCPWSCSGLTGRVPYRTSTRLPALYPFLTVLRTARVAVDPIGASHARVAVPVDRRRDLRRVAGPWPLADAVRPPQALADRGLGLTPARSFRAGSGRPAEFP